MQFFHDVLTVTVQSAGAFEAYDLVGFTGAKVAAADAPVLGVAKSPALGAGEQAPVMVIGVARLPAVGAIALGARVVSAATGGVQAAGATPANVVGRALTAAAGGDFVTILFSL
jgi:hypothetical protein